MFLLLKTTKNAQLYLIIACFSLLQRRVEPWGIRVIFKRVCFCPWWKKLSVRAFGAEAKTYLYLVINYKKIFCPTTFCVLCPKFIRDSARMERFLPNLETKSAPDKKKCWTRLWSSIIAASPIQCSIMYYRKFTTMKIIKTRIKGPLKNIYF